MFMKKGGGNKPQLYDPDNGQYSDEEKKVFFEQEMSNIVLRYIFGAKGTYEPRFPINGFHNADYCRLFLEHCLPGLNRDFPEEKVTEYLLKKREINDKSSFFALHGYTMANASELYQQLMDRADFSQMEFERLTDFGIKLSVPTEIFSKKEGKRIQIRTIWIYQRNEMMHFVTVDLKRRAKDEKH